MLQLIKFSFVGVMNTTITILTYNALVLVDVNYLIANIIGYILGVFNSYYFNSKLVFKNKYSLNVFVKFILTNITYLFLNSYILYVCVNFFKMNKLIAQFPSILIVFIINFIVNKFWVFK